MNWYQVDKVLDYHRVFASFTGAAATVGGSMDQGLKAPGIRFYHFSLSISPCLGFFQIRMRKAASHREWSERN